MNTWSALFYNLVRRGGEWLLSFVGRAGVRTLSVADWRERFERCGDDRE